MPHPLADAATARSTLVTMWEIRRFEEAVDDLFARGLMHGTMHLSIGQEASPTGVCLALRDTDAITSPSLLRIGAAIAVSPSSSSSTETA